VTTCIDIDYSLYTAAGGPGLAALADPVVTERAAKAVKALGRAASGKAILTCLREAEIDIFLLVFDSRGPGAVGCLTTGSPEGTTLFFLDGRKTDIRIRNRSNPKEGGKQGRNKERK
jgi:hypothetical protein